MGLDIQEKGHLLARFRTAATSGVVAKSAGVLFSLFLRCGFAPEGKRTAVEVQIGIHG